jgi:large subunit ribosomal protein L29
MALLKTAKIKELSAKERQEKVTELRNELLRERGISAMGGAPPSPGKIKALRTNIARIVTVMREEGEL